MNWIFAFLLVTNYVLVTCTGEAAERDRPIRIGALTPAWGSTPHVIGLRDGLEELGYREHQDFVIGVRFTQGDTAALPVAAGKLVKQGADIIFAVGIRAARAAKSASGQVPMVFAAGGGDPVALGLIQSFARPGGNITGVTHLDLGLCAKRLEVFQELVPGLNRVLFPYNMNEAYDVSEAKAYREASQILKILLVEKALRTREDAQTVLAELRKGDVHGILSPSRLTLNIRGIVLEATSQRGIATMFPHTFFAEQGGLASYSANLYESGRMAARLAGKIFKGERPADIPVEVNQKIEFVINLKVANALGLKIAPQLLYRADRLIQ